MILPYLTFGLLLMFLTKDLLAPPPADNSPDSSRKKDLSTDEQKTLVEIMEQSPELTYALAKYVVAQGLSDK